MLAVGILAIAALAILMALAEQQTDARAFRVEDSDEVYCAMCAGDPPYEELEPVEDYELDELAHPAIGDPGWPGPVPVLCCRCNEVLA